MKTGSERTISGSGALFAIRVSWIAAYQGW